MKDSLEMRREALRSAMAAKQVSPTALSIQIGRGKDYINDFLTGRKTGFSASVWQQITEILEMEPLTRAPAREIIAHRPAPQLIDRVNTMPVYAAAEGGDGHLIVTTDEIDRVPRPYPMENIADAYGILVTGDSMWPAYEPGDVALINPRLPPMRNTTVVLYQDMDHGERTATIKHLTGWNEKDWTAKQWNPAKSLKFPRSQWTVCHRVEGKWNRR